MQKAKIRPHMLLARVSHMDQEGADILGATNARVGELIGTILYLGFFFQKTGITHHF